jgi:hypothetical protein
MSTAAPVLGAMVIALERRATSPATTPHHAAAVDTGSRAPAFRCPPWKGKLTRPAETSPQLLALIEKAIDRPS